MLQDEPIRANITKKLARQLGLRSLGWVRTAVNTFAGHRTRTIKADIVRLEIQLTNGSSMTITALSVPTVTRPIFRYPIPKRVKKMTPKGVKLADEILEGSEAKKVSINLLTGNDFYEYEDCQERGSWCQDSTCQKQSLVK